MPKGQKLNDKEIMEYKSMPLEQLNNNIKNCLYYAKHGGTSQGRKAFFKKLVQLEAIREEVYNIEAPHRDFRKI